MGCCKSRYEDEYLEYVENDSKLSKFIREYRFPFENIVIEGSSSNISLVVGAYDVLWKGKIIQNIKKFAGASSGSFIAACGAIKMDSDTLKNEIMEIDGEKFKDGDFGIIRDTIRFFNNFGFYRGDKLEEWIEDVLCRQTGISKLTFEDIYQIYDNQLYIPVVNLTTMNVDIYSRENTPMMVVSRAIKQSCTLPFLFEPEYNDNKEMIIDGGVCYNYPIDIFDNVQNDSFKSKLMSSFSKLNMKTLGLKIMGPNEEKRKPYLRYKSDNEIDDIKDFGLSLINIQLLQIEKLHFKLVDKYWERTIILSSTERNVDDFNVNEKEKIRDINSGAITTTQALIRFIKNGVF